MDHDDPIALGSMLKGAARRMARDRYQEGRVVLVGKRVKKWRGHFYVYQRQADRREIRRHRNIPLGLKAQMEKGQAKRRPSCGKSSYAGPKTLSPLPLP